MQEADQHDLSDDSDYAASQQQAIGSVARCDSAKSGVSEPGGSEVVYSKDNVTIHPSQYAAERIRGRLRLIKQDSSLFMSWIPYKPSIDGADSVGRHSDLVPIEKDRYLYTIKALPLGEVRSIRRHTPTLGWQYIIVVLSSGLAYPPFYFYSGGVREFLGTLKQHVFIVRSAEDPNVFLVNNFQDPLQKSLSSLELPRVVSIANGTSLHNSISFASADNSEQLSGVRNDGSSSISEYGSRQKHRSHDPTRDISLHVLEKFSMVTKFARETTSSLFRENHINSINAYEKKQQVRYAEDNSIDSRHKDEQAASDKVSVASDPLEFDKLPLVWGKQRERPLYLEEWAAFLDSEGRVMDSKALRKRVFYGGVDHDLRKEVWKFLLGYHEYDSTYAEREYLAAVKKSEYEVIKSQWQSISPMQAKRFTKFRERKGLIEKDVVRTDRSVPYYEEMRIPMLQFYVTYC
uniref:Rab-GAP TBC domain-containing protein n=1 Tax=Ananas comosus var. bracteatus TaxID=296719 RepID=A0A6V7P521_ANACO|nr:unnamed protein product [Ananas comosus var. bracteatus]